MRRRLFFTCCIFVGLLFISEGGTFSQDGGVAINDDGVFSNAGGLAYWYTSTEYNNFEVWMRYLNNNLDEVYRGHLGKEFGHSVRCVKNY